MYLLNLLAEFSFKASNFWKMDYIHRWDLYMASYWVPLIVGVIFLIMFFKSIIEKRPFLVVLYLLLVAGCVTIIGTGQDSAIINAMEGLVGH